MCSRIRDLTKYRPYDCISDHKNACFRYSSTKKISSRVGSFLYVHEDGLQVQTRFLSSNYEVRYVERRRVVMCLL